MPFKIVRNDITRMTTEAIVNTANEQPMVGAGCDTAVYKAAGYEDLLSYRRQHIGVVQEGEAFLTPGFALPAKYIIHAVSPLYADGGKGEEEKLRSCYRSSLAIAAKHGISSIAFPLISTGSYGYPKEEGMRIAIDEIHSFLLTHDAMIYLVVFDDSATQMGRSIDPELEAYIDRNYVREKREEEYSRPYYNPEDDLPELSVGMPYHEERRKDKGKEKASKNGRPVHRPPSSGASSHRPSSHIIPSGMPQAAPRPSLEAPCESMSLEEEDAAFEELDRKIAERLSHMSDTFSQYLLYLIQEKGLGNADVYKRAIVDKKVFSKIKNNPQYHPDKSTALRLCIGAMLNLDESTDLLRRAGYALSPCDKADIIFSYFIESGHYDMVDLDIQMEEHGLPCIIS